MADLTSLTLAEARDQLRAKKISAKELAEAHLAEMEKARVLNSYVLETPDHARKMAAASDARIAKGESGPAWPPAPLATRMRPSTPASAAFLA